MIDQEDLENLLTNPPNKMIGKIVATVLEIQKLLKTVILIVNGGQATKHLQQSRDTIIGGILGCSRILGVVVFVMLLFVCLVEIALTGTLNQPYSLAGKSRWTFATAFIIFVILSLHFIGVAILFALWIYSICCFSMIVVIILSTVAVFNHWLAVFDNWMKTGGGLMIFVMALAFTERLGSLFDNNNQSLSEDAPEIKTTL